MLKDLQLDHVYIACGYTDLRLGIDGLSNLVQLHFELDPYTILFCGRMKCYTNVVTVVANKI